jgi:hypothetical protein
MNSAFITLIIISCIFSILPPSSTYAIRSAGTLNEATSGRSLNLMLEPSPNPVVKGTQTNFKVIFNQNAGTAVQPHIDYDVTIFKNGKQVFQASALAGHPNQPLHTAEGIVTIPYTFQQQGTYVMYITVYGILFNPIRPEVAQFPISVS